jgi:hypothetical protein
MPNGLKLIDSQMLSEAPRLLPVSIWAFCYVGGPWVGFSRKSYKKDRLHSLCMPLPKPPTNFFKIRIASGEHRGFYVGPASSDLLKQPKMDADKALEAAEQQYAIRQTPE